MVTKTLKSCKFIKPVIVKETDTVLNVAQKIKSFQERRVFVVNSKKFPVGVISLVDINDRVVALGKDSKKTKAKEIMSYPIRLVLDIRETLEGAAKKMILKDNYYCPVVDKSTFKGLVTYASLINSLKNGKR